MTFKRVPKTGYDISSMTRCRNDELLCLVRWLNDNKLSLNQTSNQSAWLPGLKVLRSRLLLTRPKQWLMAWNSDVRELPVTLILSE